MRHIFSSAKSDGGDATLVRPSNWNADHAPLPTTQAAVVEDFIGGDAVSGILGELGWLIGTTGSGSVAVTTSTGVHPGQCLLSTGASSGSLAVISLQSLSFNNTAVLWEEMFIHRGVTNDTNTTVRLGVSISVSADPPTAGIYFEKLAADTNWFRVTRSASVQTRTDTGIAVNATSQKFKIRRIDTTTIGFTIGDASEQTATTNIPTGGSMFPFWFIINTSAANKTMNPDYFHWVTTISARP